jgi:hypothetical protein
MIWKRNETDRKITPGEAQELLVKNISEAIGAAKEAGVADVVIGRILSAQARDCEHRASIRNYVHG